MKRIMFWIHVPIAGWWDDYKLARDLNPLSKKGYNRSQPCITLDIDFNLLNLSSDDTPRRSEGKNKGQIKRIGIHPGWRDDS